MAMADVDIPIELGSGVAAAQRYWRGTDPVPKKRERIQDNAAPDHAFHVRMKNSGGN